MRGIYTQFSGLAGLLAFLNQIWSYAPLERAIIVGFGTGLGVYLLLLLGDIAINKILAYRPPSLAEKSAGVSESSAESREERKAKAA